MNKQAVLEISASALISQGEKSSGVPPGSGFLEESCLYRGNKGLKCAIGHLIPDSLYAESMELMSVSALLRHHPKLLEDFEVRFGDMETEDIRFLEKLQAVHDGCPPSHWKLALAALSEECGLAWKA